MPLVVAEPDVVEGDVAPRTLDAARPLDDVDRLVEVVEDPVEQRERALHLELHAEQAADREEEPRLQGREGDERADRDRVGAPRDRPPGEQVDERRHHGERRLDRRHHPTPGHAAPHLEAGEPLRLRIENRSGEVARATHRLPEQDPRDRQRLLDERRDVRERVLTLRRHLLPLLADPLRQPDEQRQQRERERREAPVEQQHRDDRGEHRRHVREHGGRRRRDDVLDPADVVRDPALHLARARPREERERQALQMPVDGRSEVVHDRLADEVREERHVDHDGARDHDRDRDHPRHERRRAGSCRRSPRRTGSTWIAVSSTSRSRNGGIDADRCREEDQAAGGGELRLVPPEQRDDPPRVCLPDGRVRGAHGWFEARRFPPPSGHESSVPAEGRPGPLRERLDRRPDPRRQLLRRGDRRRSRLDADRLADDDANACAPRDARPGPERTVGADDPHGHDRRARWRARAGRHRGARRARRFRGRSPGGRSQPRRPLAAQPRRPPARRGRRGRGARESLRARRARDRRCGSPRAPAWRGTGAAGRRRFRGRTDQRASRGSRRRARAPAGARRLPHARSRRPGSGARTPPARRGRRSRRGDVGREARDRAVDVLDPGAPPRQPHELPGAAPHGRAVEPTLEERVGALRRRAPRHAGSPCASLPG